MSLQTKLLLVLAGIGILNTMYLIYHKIRGTEVACLFFPKEWCHKVQHAKQSKMFGIPNSVLGFLMYLFIFVYTLLLFYGVITLLWPLQLVIIIGFLFSMYFLYVQAFVLKAFCTWCVLSAFTFTGLLITIFWV